MPIFLATTCATQLIITSGYHLLLFHDFRAGELDFMHKYAMQKTLQRCQ